MTAIRIAMIEDNAPYAATLGNFLRHPDHGIEWTGIYPDSETAIKQLPRDAPDVVLVDMHLPGLDGVACIAALKEKLPGLLCLVLTTFDDSQLLFDALKAGACGYLLKSTPPHEVAAAIHQARAGGSPMSPQIARKVVSHFHRKPATAPHTALTDREREVIGLLAKGARYKEIAAELFISIETVRSHIKKIYDKLHATSRTEAINRFRGES